MKDKDTHLMMERMYPEAQWGAEPAQQEPAQQEPAAGQQVDLRSLLATQSLNDFREEYGRLTANDPSMLRQFDKAVGQLKQLTGGGDPTALQRGLVPAQLDSALSGPLGSGVITRFGDPSKASRKHFETLARAEFGERRGADVPGPNRLAGSSWD